MRIKINEDNLIRWPATLAPDGTAVSSGTAAWNLKDSDGTSIATGSLTYGSSEWRGTIDKDDVASLSDGDTGTLEVTLDSSGNEGHRYIEWSAEYHRAGC